MQVINIPAPEEAKTYKEYVNLFRLRNPGVDYKGACKAVGRDMKQFFDMAWSQPEAEAIHAAYNP